MEQKITKDMLKVGDIVKMRNGDLLIIISDSHNSGSLCTYSSRYRKSGFKGLCNRLSHYSDDLIFNDSENKTGNYDIIAVFKGSEPGRHTYSIYEYIFNNSDKLPKIDWDWESEKEMTKEEIESILGYKIKIVDGEECKNE